MRIRRAGPRDAGKYVCVARNLSGEAESVCVVRFLEKGSPAPEVPKHQAPKFTRTMQDITVQDGQHIR